MENNSETTPRSKGRRKPSSEKSPQSKGTDEADLRPDLDIILSLKDPVYKSIMEKFFRRLGDKKNLPNDAEKEAAREAFQVLKDRNKGRTRFFKPEARHKSNSYIEVDEATALLKITADIYRRMESSKRWMNEDSEDDSQRKSPSTLPQAPPEPSTKGTRTVGKRKLPVRVASTAAKSPPSKKKKPSKAPQSLPFITDTNIVDIIVEEEARAQRKSDSSRSHSPNDQNWTLDEVIEFFRGVYCHGWNNTEKVSKMVKTRGSQQVKSYASKLAMRVPELKKFFSAKGQKSKEKPKEKQVAKVKRRAGSAKGSSSVPKQQLNISQRDPAVIAASVMGTMRQSSSTLSKPKVMICLGDHVIDTESEPSLIQPAAFYRKRPADTLPDYFDPSIRPSVPTNNQQIYIPGNKVYARWLDKDDPGSYGTWYPGFVYSSKIAPIQDEYPHFNNNSVPHLLYHVKFDDGAESMDLDTQDIMMQDQYEVWLKDLEKYYALHVDQELTWKRLPNKTRVYAKWNDPTDPELHGSWMLGQIHSSTTWEDDDNQWRHSYHILFDNGDQDEDLQDGDVLEEDAYWALIGEKMERGRNKSRLSGFDLITEASKISSPIKTGANRPNATVDGGSRKQNSYSDGSDAPDDDGGDGDNDDDMLVEELRCNETLELRPPSPTHVARLSSTPSPDVHYGIYMKSKPLDLPQDQSKPEPAAKPSPVTEDMDVESAQQESQKPTDIDQASTNISQPVPDSIDGAMDSNMSANADNLNSTATAAAQKLASSNQPAASITPADSTGKTVTLSNVDTSK